MRMADLAEGFIAMPGGIGTLEELFEVWTWNQIGFHNKPLGLLDAGGYFQPLLAFLRTTVEKGFVRPDHLDFVCVETDPARLLEAMEKRAIPIVPKWIDRESV